MKRIRPQAVIFDYGNVLSAPQGPAEIGQMAAALNVSSRDFQGAYWQYRAEYDSAALDPDTYWRGVGQILSRTLTDSQIANLIAIDCRSWSYPAAVIPEWARALRASGLKTAVLSNMPLSVREYVDGCDWLPQFDQRTFSCDVGVAKPHPEIFRHCLRGLDIDPGDILFLDDRPDNVRAGERLGLQAIVYGTVEQAARDIALRFELPVSML